jgi:nucleoside-diphosphate-sugar epimerase
VIAVTGAAGFIGAALCRREAARGRAVRRFVHRSPGPDGGDNVVPVDLGCADFDELARRLDGVTAIVHLAGRATGSDPPATDPDAEYRRDNVDATERLARAALAAGVRRFILASTVKVNGEATAVGRPFRPDDPPAPWGAYARSKLGAETALARIARGTPMAAIVLRLPLVYGPGAGGNFRRLVDAIAGRRWLPFGAIDNRRSLLGLPNLLDALDAALAAPSGLAGTHFVADADSVSTPALVRAIAAALGVSPRLVPVPVAALRLVGKLAGQTAAIARLTQSLEVDTTSLSTATAWRPRPFAIDAATLAGHGGQRHIIAVHE